MRWDVSYTRETTKEPCWYSEDNELNYDGSFIEAESAQEAESLVRSHISELMRCNALGVNEGENEVFVFEASDNEFIERYFDFSAQRVYELLNEKGVTYLSRTPGLIGGHKKLKIYGRLDCPSALRHIEKGNYAKHRVFFADEQVAKAAGYRPCGILSPQDLCFSIFRKKSPNVPSFGRI